MSDPIETAVNGPALEDTEKQQSNNNPIENETARKESTDQADDYQKYIKYDDNGTATYTDSTTNQEFLFDKEKNQWVPKSDSGEDAANCNPYENEHYRWCSETNKWILKENSTANTTDALENEHYKWNAEKNEWEPKNTDQRFATSVFKDGQHLYTDADGAVFFWDEEKKAWFPKIDDDFMAIYQTNYGFIDNITKPATEEPIPKTTEPSNGPPQEENKDDQKPVTGKRKANQAQWFEESPETCTKVYVSNLPEDITEEEFVEVMSKCGMILRDANTKKMKIKLYSEPNGQLKGDGLVNYIRVESVKLALDMLDGYEVRGRKIKVQLAQFQMRGAYDPALKPKKRKKDKEKERKLQEKLLDWRPDKMRGERGKHERVVILKNLFAPETFKDRVDLIIDYQNNVRDECTKCGTVRRVVIYSSEEEGVAEVRMSDPEEADLVVQMMHRRPFGSRTVTAEIWDGKTKFKRNETDAETNERLSKWDEFLEGVDDDEKSETAEKEIEVPIPI